MDNLKENYGNMIRNCFYDAYDSEFFDYMGTFEREFEKEVPELKKLNELETNILEKYPNLRNIVNEKEYTILNKEDCNGLLEYIKVIEDKSFIIREIYFYKGYKEAYYFFKKIGLLKDKSE